MNYILYKAISPSGKMYIGITNNFKRRMKEHGSSPYAFGCALRKYGKEAFVFEFEYFNTVEEALSREAELVNLEVLQARVLYNESVGGCLSNVLTNDNPMHRQDVVDNHPSVWKKGSADNPMYNPDSKAKMIKSQACKKVSVDGKEYYGVREAARNLGISRQLAVYRLKAFNYPTWFYVNN
jgi:predicted GIY-YIG superfamily endonuclease